MIITIITTIPTTTISIIKMTTTITTNATIAIDTTNGIDTPSPSLLPIRPSPPPQYHYTTTTNTHTTTTLTNTTTTTTTNLRLSFPQHPLITNDDEFSSTHNSYVQLPDLSLSQQLVISRQSLPYASINENVSCDETRDSSVHLSIHRPSLPKRSSIMTISEQCAQLLHLLALYGGESSCVVDELDVRWIEHQTTRDGRPNNIALIITTAPCNETE